MPPAPAPTNPRILARMTAHVEETALEHHVTITWITSGWRNAESFPAEGTAYVPTIRRPRDYLVAMHELGHVADPLAKTLTNKTDTYHVVLCEGAAWAWAAANVHAGLRRHLRSADWNSIGYAFTSYVAGGT